MRKFFTTFLTLFLIGTSVGTSFACEHSANVRLGSMYTWWDQYINNEDVPLIVDNVTLSYQGDQSLLSGLAGVNVMINTIPANSALTYVQSSLPSKIISHPTTRGGVNFTLLWTITSHYDGFDPVTHTQCAQYTITWCGDGVVDSGDGEQCDAGAANGQPGSGCSTSCQPVETTPEPYCGDGIINNGETCDPQDTTHAGWGTDGCNASCEPVNNTPEPYCGDGTKDAGEMCDPADPNQVGWGNNGCNASCQPVDTPEPYCGDGIVNNGETCDPQDTTHAGWGTNGCNASCKPDNTNEGPVCASSLNGQSLSSAITAGQCDTGTPSNFTDTLNGTTHNYSWKCEATSKTADCTASYTPTKSDVPNLLIKKYAKEINTTGDSQSAPVDLSPGETFNYYYVIENTGNAEATNVMVKDTFPEHLSWAGEITIKNPSGTDVTSDWTCTKTTYNGTTRIALVCKKKTPLPANSGKYTFTVPVKIATDTPSGTDMHNVAYICTDTEGATNPTGPNGEDVCGNDNPPPPPPQVCTPTNNPQKDPACITIGGDETKLTIKKYAKTKDSAGDSQDADGAVTITPGETFNYYYVMKNEGSSPADGAIVKDTFPQYISIENIVPPSSDWTCTKGTKTFAGETRARAYLVCQTSASIPAGSTLNFTITVKVADDVPSGTPMQNIAYVCEASDADCDTTPPPPPGDGCAALPESEREKDPACVFVSDFDLSVKKYVRYNGSLNDAQTSPGVSLTQNANFEYVIRVTNAGPKTTKNTTTVQDIIPTGVEITGTPSGNGWSCATSGKKITCTTTAQISANASFPDITIPVKVTVSDGAILNIAAVDNPGEGGRCKTDGSMPTSASEYCTKDTKNSDPAYISVGDGGNQLYYIHACFGSSRTCSIQYFTDRDACRSGSPDGKCYAITEVSSCNTENYLDCTGNGNPSCGDGILQGGEECDLGTGNRDDGYCSSACKLTKKSLTVPGENPILDTWIRIPNLSAMKLGIGFMNYHFDKDPYKIVVGTKTPIFSVADTVLFGVSQKYTMPLLIDVTRNFCLEADGEGVTTAGNSRATCTPIGTAAPDYKTSDGKYVAIGQGDYFLPYNCGSNGCTYQKYTVTNTAEITLFKGGTLYPDETGSNPLTLRDRFIGGAIGKLGGITLTLNGIDIVSIPVKISGAFVSNTAGGTAYLRSVTLTSSTDALLRSFLDNLAKGNFTTTVVGNTNVSGGVQGGLTTIQNSGALLIKTDISSTGPKTITNCSDLASQLSSLNGNTGILVVKGGDLTIDCELNLTGVRTILVQNGNLVLKRNIAYQSSASTASWAFIVENGNIVIHPNVTNLAGVYIAIGNTSANGKILPPSGASTTANILKVDGSLYGNANELVQNRSYVRGNNSYNVLTSGLIITYSSRAISYPPPLLTQYLNHYTVERVAQ